MMLMLLPAFLSGLASRVCGANSVEARVDTPFSCVGRPYGFYADTTHGCRIFHICNPQVVNGVTIPNKFSYYCPEEKVFDQLHFACVPPNATSREACQQAELHYGINEAFTLREAVLASRAAEGAFSCDPLREGPYADVRSGCRSYYVCARVAGAATAFRISCPIPTVFDQRTLECIYPDLATPCEDSQKYYKVSTAPGTKTMGKPTPVVNLSPRGDLYLPEMPESSVYHCPVGNKLLSSEVVMAGLGLNNVMALHAPTASNGRPVQKPPSSNFSCDGRQYGYYADVELGCVYFHVCSVRAGSQGQREFERHTFRCEDDTVFDQEQFECRYRDEALPCERAEDYYGDNSLWNK
ncbi:hypothetical protein V5799_007392 [Amblyomma americanum]|uniref:Chitin-binding type-2 domain-containing protein n=1 Tax=Amblyomma americanum TaxID=6943 RepID=A0AAQ4FI24_AMBAM